MKCPKCESDNPEDKKYCGECGGELHQPEQTSPFDPLSWKSTSKNLDFMDGYYAHLLDNYPDLYEKLLIAPIPSYPGEIEDLLAEHEIDRINKLSTVKEVYDERRDIQEDLSRVESYRVVVETFLRFIPPALFSLVLSLLVIIPAADLQIDSLTIAILMVSIVSTFLLSLWLLTRLLSEIYEKNAYIAALNIKEGEMRREHREKSGQAAPA